MFVLRTQLRQKRLWPNFYKNLTTSLEFLDLKFTGTIFSTCSGIPYILCMNCLESQMQVMLMWHVTPLLLNNEYNNTWHNFNENAYSIYTDNWLATRNMSRLCVTNAVCWCTNAFRSRSNISAILERVIRYYFFVAVYLIVLEHVVEKVGRSSDRK